ncbi:unnamed protein product [Discula destructiva]
MDYSVTRNFTKPSTFYGLSIIINGNTSDPTVESQIAAIEGVESVWPVVRVFQQSLAGPQKGSKRSKTTNPSTPSLTKRDDTTSTVAASLLPPRVNGPANVLSSLAQSGVDKLHNLGVKGSGIKIGVIDTGVDYRHPSLGAGFGAGYKIAGGYSYVDDDDTIVDSADPLTTCVEGGHGTHVTGIIGMEDPDDLGFGLVGVAPEAEIYMYRVFPCDADTGARSDNIIAALDQAHTDGVDVVSMSISQDEQWEWYDPFADATSALVADGIAVFAAAGNNGEEGMFVPGAPGSGPDVISVGCIDNTIFPTTYSATDSAGNNISYASVFPYSGVHDVYFLTGTGTGCTADEWTAANTALTDKNSTILAFHYSWNASDCDFSVREEYWAKYGFTYIMVYADESSDPYAQQHVLLEQSDETTLYSNLLPADGVALAGYYAAAGGFGSYTLDFTGQTVVSVSMATGGDVSYFTSFGPDWEYLELKPQLSAPGASILATWPLGFNSGYAVIRGTSMATPYAAAAYALIKAAFPSLSVAQIRSLLQSTSAPAASAYYPDLLQTAFQQGAGLINVYDAYLSANSTVIIPSEFAIGDTDDYLGSTLNFTIANTGTEPQTYTISHTGAAMMFYRPYGFHLDPFVPETAEDLTQPEYGTYADIAFTSGASLTVAAGESETVFFTVAPPSDIDENKVPVISGFITVDSTSGLTYSLPYGGLPYSRWNASYLDTGIHPLNATLSVAWPTIIMFNEDTGEIANHYNGSGIMVLDKRPIIIDELDVGPLFNTLQPSWNVRVELLAANTTFVPDIYGYDRNQSTGIEVLTKATYRNTMEDGTTPTYGLQGSNPGKPIAGLIDFEDMDVIADTDEFEDEGGEAPTVVGDYRFLVSVLKWGGLVENWPGDWETWLSPRMRIVDGGLTNYGMPAGTPLF